MNVRDLIPRRADGLPPGQRAIRAFPRFSDTPLRWAPPVWPVELRLSIDGTDHATLTSEDLGRFDHVEPVSDFHCVTTWTSRAVRWGGVRLLDVIDRTLGADVPSSAVAHAADRQSAIFVTEDLLADDVLLATTLDGEPLDRRHGAPLRLVSPRQYGYKNVKHLTGIDFRTTEPTSTLGPKEHLRARVAHEERHSSLPNWAVRIPYRLSVIPTVLAAERGLRNSPETAPEPDRV